MSQSAHSRRWDRGRLILAAMWASLAVIGAATGNLIGLAGLLPAAINVWVARHG